MDIITLGWTNINSKFSCLLALLQENCTSKEIDINTSFHHCFDIAIVPILHRKFGDLDRYTVQTGETFSHEGEQYSEYRKDI